ncbi:SgcJ/EcaC family oxidoreductase [Nocardia farcinica]|uniref:SgcJ/EcaC family oxidoreductase n=2 Tax=Nocardia farcinica TaxID=37329 RepID=UPI001895568B|nr:SgcJ/EcaC family oxidoreductase [Nocardia farcinica]MBF6257980.1 SgcJ/EcaC family oxidoreductase [Nocardia farcinica]MBF6292941.1 SgcJ/EcaC family oxidoreductase [Nocardia farcinica]MBF6375971.1 SgcJ/EcaC family oxidoreductase [Nocardia farcinica]MBF6379236.1 SgcJ/EcaC family oxidoreductase [Nocardia farcinica]MBF6418125.1 SgcJ/EcaC family oxidoreductase [Nocardia farcinica]
MDIHGVITGLAGAWNDGDARRWAEHFTDDVTFVDEIGAVRQGRDAMADAHQHWFATLYRDSTVAIEVSEQRELAPGVTLAYLEAVITMPSPHPGTMRTAHTAVVTGGQITAYHSSIRPDVEGKDLSEVVSVSAGQR